MNQRRFSARWRLQFIALLFLLGLGALAGRLWMVQVAHGEEWTKKIRGSSEATVRIPSVRGEIRDRNGVTLVQNRASYEVDFYLPEMVKGYRERVGPPPLTEYRSTINGMPKDLKEPDIVKIVNSGIVPRLDDLDLARDYNSVQLQRHFRTNTEVPYSYLKDIDFETMAKFSEHDVGLPGVDITIKPVRSYVYGALAAHLLGYVGPPDDTNKEEAKKFTFYQSDVEGKSNIEKTMDEYLKGKPGIRYMRRNAKGQIDGVLREVPPQAGANVDLTIDARIQAIVEEALRAVGRGAAVVVDPNNGDILAMASVPSFNPNTFIPSIKAKDWEELKKAPADPLINRAVSAFPPGSTFKLVTALAGLKKGLGNARYDCGGGVGYGDHFFKCHIAEKGRTHGTVGLGEAIKVSCNSYFYQLGNAAGIDAIDEIGDLLGLGKATGVEITGEQPGVLPGPDWMRIHFPRERWSSAYTANVSIGQGFDLVSPLQLAMIYTAVANGGVSYQPRLVKNVVSADGKPILNEKGEPVVSSKPKVRGDLRFDVRAEQIEQARRACLSVVNEGGTGARARLPNVLVAGKTGSAQATTDGKSDTIAWFGCFAPYDRPRYTVAVMVQGGKGGGAVAAPIAARILERTFALEQGKFESQLAWLEPARKPNPFQFLESVEFKDSGLGTQAEDETNPTDAQSSAAQLAATGPAPDVEPEADAAGKVKKVVRPVVVATPPPRKPSFFERLFGVRPKPAPAPTPPPRQPQRPVRR
ncbi:MAG TPA: penicillin-binding protein 2 [Chthoniobacterales bacterium]|jgi:penicillin-binding protein 2|nr:penicillin-binding protein 2 [Chthoniobacterales bacterium]